MNEIFLLPGEIAVLDQPGVIRTILGSCIAVVIYDQRTRIGGVNHYLLPTQAEGTPVSMRYGSSAIPALIAMLTKLGAPVERLCAGIYGGASVVDALSSKFTIGDENTALARSTLSMSGIPIVDEDTGGNRGRKLEFRSPACRISLRHFTMSGQ